MRFLSKAVIVYSGKQVRFDCKNNHWWSKLAFFRLVIMLGKSILYSQFCILYYSWDQEMPNPLKDSPNMWNYSYSTVGEFLLTGIFSPLYEF